MPGSYLLDTNIIIAFWKSDPSIVEKLTGVNIVLSCTVVGELLWGAHKSQQSEPNINRIDDYVSSNVVFVVDYETAKFYGRVKSVLMSTGNPIPENDVWIAALALQHDLILVSRDHHFKAITGLKLEFW